MKMISTARFKDFEYDGVTYKRFSPHVREDITMINGTRVTTLEQTVVDSIHPLI